MPSNKPPRRPNVPQPKPPIPEEPKTWPANQFVLAAILAGFFVLITIALFMGWI